MSLLGHVSKIVLLSKLSDCPNTDTLLCYYNYLLLTVYSGTPPSAFVAGVIVVRTTIANVLGHLVEPSLVDGIQWGIILSSIARHPNLRDCLCVYETIIGSYRWWGWAYPYGKILMRFLQDSVKSYKNFSVRIMGSSYKKIGTFL